MRYSLYDAPLAMLLEEYTQMPRKLDVNPDEGTHPTDDAVHVPADQTAVLVGAKAAPAEAPTDPNSEEFRREIGHTPETAQADLDAALTHGSAHPTPFPQANAERQRARAEQLGEPKTNVEVADALSGQGTDINRDLLIRAKATALDNTIGSWIESVDNPFVKYRVTQNVSDQVLDFEIVPATENAPAVSVPVLPGDFFGEDGDGNRVVLTAALVHGDYRPARRGPNGRAVVAV